MSNRRQLLSPQMLYTLVLLLSLCSRVVDVVIYMASVVDLFARVTVSSMPSRARNHFGRETDLSFPEQRAFVQNFSISLGLSL